MSINRPENLAVADFGKTHTRIKVLSEQGKFLTGTEISSARFRAADGALDVIALQHWCEDALADLYWEQPFTHLMPVTHGATAVALTDDGIALPVRDYETPIDRQISNAYDARRTPFEDTGSPPLPAGLNLGRQLYAQQCTDRAFAEAGTLLTYPQYWTWRWSGAAGSDVSSLGCHTDLWLPRQGTWSPLACEMGWNHKFPPLVRAGGIAGPLSWQMSRRIQARNLVDVHWGVHDSNAALAAFLGMEEPFTLLSTGTWLVAFAVGSDAQNLDEKRDNLWMVDVFERPVACARFMAGRERECIAGNAPLADHQTIMAVLKSGTFALPGFAPGGPFPGLKGAIIGKTPIPEAERAAVASLYIALMADATLDSIAATGPLIVEGPLAEDEITLTALASLRPAQPIYSTTAPCVVRGAARLVFGADAVPPPELGQIEIDSQLTPLMHDLRRRWRQSIKEAISS